MPNKFLYALLSLVLNKHDLQSQSEVQNNKNVNNSSIKLGEHHYRAKIDKLSRCFSVAATY